MINKIFKQLIQLQKGDAFKSFILNGFGLLFLLLQQVTFARILDPNSFGVFSFIQSIYALAMVITTWGMTTLSSKEIGASNDLEVKKGFYFFSHILVLILNILFTLLILFYTPNFKLFDHIVELNTILLLASIFFYLKSFLELLSIQYQAEGNTIISKLTSHIIPVGLTILVLLFTTLFVNEISLYCFFFSICIALLISALMIVSIKKPEYFNLTRTKKVFKKKYWIKTGMSLMILTGLYIILGRMNSFIIGLYLEPKNVGFYSVCLSLSTLILFGLTAANQVFAPRIAKSYKEGNFNLFQILILQSTRIGFYTTLFFFTFIVLFGKLILGFFGPEFTDAYEVLIILSLGYFASTIAGPVGLSLTMTGKEKYVIFATAVSALVNIILAFMWVEKYGIIGVAYANAIGLIMMNLPLSFYVKRKFRYRTYMNFKINK